MFAALKKELAMDAMLEPIALTVPALLLPVFAACATDPPGADGALTTLPDESVGSVFKLLLMSLES